MWERLQPRLHLAGEAALVKRHKFLILMWCHLGRVAVYVTDEADTQTLRVNVTYRPCLMREQAHRQGRPGLPQSATAFRG